MWLLNILIISTERQRDNLFWVPCYSQSGIWSSYLEKCDSTCAWLWPHRWWWYHFAEASRWELWRRGATLRGMRPRTDLPDLLRTSNWIRLAQFGWRHSWKQRTHACLVHALSPLAGPRKRASNGDCFLHYHSRRTTVSASPRYLTCSKCQETIITKIGWRLSLTITLHLTRAFLLFEAATEACFQFLLKKSAHMIVRSRVLFYNKFFSIFTHTKIPLSFLSVWLEGYRKLSYWIASTSSLGLFGSTSLGLSLEIFTRKGSPESIPFSYSVPVHVKSSLTD